MSDDQTEETEVEETTEPEPVSDDVTSDITGHEQTDEEPETFPREYVEKLRKESAGYRDRAKRADEFGHRLHVALVAATGRLADPDDLPFDEAHLDDETALSAALDALVERKPHLASRKPRGDVGQGQSGSTDTVDLAGILRARAS